MKNPVGEFPSGIHPRGNFTGIEIPGGKNFAEYGPVDEFPVGKYSALKYPTGECSDGKSPPAFLLLSRSEVHELLKENYYTMENMTVSLLVVLTDNLEVHF